jgi:hypothetical protein
MTRRPDDQTPEPPGGRAAERLRMFEDARRPKEDIEAAEKRRTRARPKRAKRARGGRRGKRKGASDADQG